MDSRTLGRAVLLVALFATNATSQGDSTRAARARLEFAVPPASPKERVRWVGDCDAALEEARRRNVPVVAILSDDQSSGFTTVSAAVYAKPKFAAFSRKCVLLIAFGGEAHASKLRQSGAGSSAREEKWCGLFDVSCADHQRSHERVLRAYAMREYWNPLQVFLEPEGPDGIERGRVEGHKTTQERLDEEFALVAEPMGPGLDFETYRELLVRLRALVDQREKKGHAVAYGELGKLEVAEERGTKDPSLPRPLRTAAMTAFVGELRRALLAEGDGLLEDAAVLARNGDPNGARKAYSAIEKSFRALDPGKKAAAALVSLPPQEPQKK